MPSRVLFGKGTATRGTSNFGLWVSKPSANVETTTANNLIFDSTTVRTGLIYAGANFTATSSAITWTSGSKATLTYIPEVLVNEANTAILHNENIVSNPSFDSFTEDLIREYDTYKISNTSVTPLRMDVSYAPSNTSRTSAAGAFVVLKIPNAFGFMGNTYVDSSGTTQNLGNHPSLGNTENLW